MPKIESEYCPICGEVVGFRSWQGSIYECDSCGNMIDLDVLEDEEDD